MISQVLSVSFTAAGTGRSSVVRVWIMVRGFPHNNDHLCSRLDWIQREGNGLAFLPTGGNFKLLLSLMGDNSGCVTNV